MNIVLKNLIHEICIEKNIDYHELSNGYIVELKKGNKLRHLIGHLFDLNPQAAGNIINDKYATFSVLKHNCVPVVEHEIIFNPAIRKDYMSDSDLWNRVTQYFNQNNHELVIKPSKGNNGNHVYLCKDFSQVGNAINHCFKEGPTVVLCPFYSSLAEYRTFYLDGKCLFTYKKVKPFVVGDGISSLQDLINKNSYILPENVLKEIPLSYIPKENEKVELVWKFNLSGGAVAEFLDDTILEKEIHEIVKEAAHYLNIRFATVDILHTINKGLKILEVNSGICMEKFIDQIDSGYQIAKNIYSKAIDKMFI